MLTHFESGDKIFYDHKAQILLKKWQQESGDEVLDSRSEEAGLKCKLLIGRQTSRNLFFRRRQLIPFSPYPQLFNNSRIPTKP